MRDCLCVLSRDHLADADRWKEAKGVTKKWLNDASWSTTHEVACYVQHLEAEIERLKEGGVNDD